MGSAPQRMFSSSSSVSPAKAPTFSTVPRACCRMSKTSSKKAFTLPSHPVLIRKGSSTQKPRSGLRSERSDWTLSCPRMKLGCQSYHFSNRYGGVQQAASDSIGGEDIEIRVAVIALNAVDVEGDNASLVVENIGREAVGVISRLGSKVVDFKLGNTVLMLQQGCLATHLRQHQAFVAHLPRTLSVEDSVALPRVFSVAWHALTDVGRLGKGQSILIHHAAGGVGQAAVQIAVFVGATVFATVSTGTKKSTLVERYGLPKSHIFDSRCADFAAGLLRATSNRGVDVVLNTRSSLFVRESHSCVAEFGCFLDLATGDEGAGLGHSSASKECNHCKDRLRSNDSLQTGKCTASVLQGH
jgi:NADPH:quinone reductase-like Zn-dependent oxidoreductase